MKIPVMDVVFRNTLFGQAQTESLAAAFAAIARPGDLLALSGDLGAGKSTFARAFIRSATGKPDIDVPSPTFTLVQSYDGSDDVAIFHTDLYRLSGPEDTEDLGLDEEREHSILLVEWPDRMPLDWQQDALQLNFALTDNSGAEERELVISTANKDWQERLSGVVHVLSGPNE